MTGRLACLIALLGLQSIASAQSALKLPANTLYGCTFRENSRLLMIDPTTGEETLVGKVGEECTDIAFNGDQLYGVSFTSIFRIDPITGEASAAMAHGFKAVNALVAVPDDPNLFYAMSAKDEMSALGVPFLRIDARTGKGTLVGYIGQGLSSAGDLVFFEGKLWATLNRDESTSTILATVDPRTGKATPVFDTGIDSIWGLESRNGKMYGATDGGHVLVLNPSTGNAALVGTTGMVLGGLAKSP